MIVVDTMNLGYLLLNHPSFSEDVREMARVDNEKDLYGIDYSSFRSFRATRNRTVSSRTMS